MALKGQTTRASYLEWDSMVLLLQKLERDGHYKFELLIAMGCYTALRVGDLLKLRWENVLNKDVFELVESKTKKTRKIRLNPALIEIIFRLHEKMGITDNSELLFNNKTKTKAITIQYVNRKLKEIVNHYNISIPKNATSSHLFRKTLGRHVWEKNNYTEKSLILLSELFGHSSLKVSKIYLGIKEEEISDVYLSL